jgi:hypothetical protein
MDPTKFGPCIWKSIHIIALAAPLDAPREYIDYYTRIADVLPCKKCANHYRENLEKEPVDLSDLFAWSVRMHNRVNKDLGKKTYSVREAYLLYTSDPNRNIYKLAIILVLLKILVFFIVKHGTCPH